MIKNKNDLFQYLKQDLNQFGGMKPGIKDFILSNENWYIYQYKKHLRYFEYYLNTKSGLNIFLKILPFVYHYFLYKRLSHKMHYVIMPNTTGPGLTLYHIGDFTHVRQGCSIGKNCTIVVGTVFGRRHGGNELITVGDNCYFGIGSKILGKVNIGNNVQVGACAIVTKDVPDNSTVVGYNQIIK